MFTSKLKYKEHSDFMLHKGGHASQLNGRSNDRILMSRRGKLITPDKRMFEALTHDASSTGLFVICAACFPVGQILGLEFKLNKDRMFHGSVEVMHWCEDGIGVKILNLDREVHTIYLKTLEAGLLQNKGSCAKWVEFNNHNIHETPAWVR